MTRGSMDNDLGTRFSRPKRGWSRRSFLGGSVIAAALIASTALAACSTGQAPMAPTTASTSASTPEATPTMAGAPAQPAASPAAPSTGNKPQIRFFGSETQAAMKAITVQVQKFSAQTGIPVEYSIATGNEFNAKLQTMMAGGTPPDLHYMDFRNFARFAFDGQLLDLLPLANRDKYDLTDFHPNYLVQCYWEKKLYANGRDFGWRQIFYNVDLFKKSGVPLPPDNWDAPGWTFDDFRAAAEKLTQRDTSGRTTVWGFANSTDYFGWVYSNGGRFIDANNEHEMVTQPPAINALEFLHDLLNKWKVAQTPAASQEIDSTSAFMTGRAAMIVNPTATGVITYRAIKQFSWDTAPLPKGPDLSGPRRDHGGGSGWSLAARGPHHDEAWELSKFISGKETQTELAKAGFAPSRISVMESEAWIDPSQPPKSKQVMTKGGDHVVQNPQILVWGEFQNTLDKLLDDVWLGKHTAQEIAPQLKSSMDALMAKNAQLLSGKKGN
jgi:multiple sugar transport system substrate-binding protein